jgi:hypothetical protein
MKHCSGKDASKVFFINVHMHRKNGQGEESCATQCISSNANFGSFTTHIGAMDFTSYFVVLSFVGQTCEETVQYCICWT